jgi:hypothetical protein
VNPAQRVHRTAEGPSERVRPARREDTAPRGVPAFLQPPTATPREEPAPEPVPEEPSATEEPAEPAEPVEPVPGAEELEETEAATPEEAEEEAAASAEEGGEEEGEGEGEEEPAEEEEEGEEEGEEEPAEGEAAPEEGAEQPVAPAAGEAAASEGVPTPEELGIEAPRPPRLGGTSPPRIEQPPKLAPRQVQELEERTRISPDEHHDRVRMGVNRVSRLARRAQLDIVHLLEGEATDTYDQIVARALQVPGVAAGAIARVRAVLDGTVAEINTLAAEKTTLIGQREEENLTAADTREEATLEGVEQIIATAMPEMFDIWLETKEDVELTASPWAEEIRGTPNMPGYDAAAAALTLSSTFEGRTGDDDRMTYVNERIAVELPALGRDKAADMAAGAERRADAFISEEFMTQFALQFLQTLNPALVATHTTAIEDQETQTSEAGQTRLVLGSARDQALAVIESSRLRAEMTLHQTRDQLVEGLGRAGRMAHRSLMHQAEAGKRGLLQSASPFADTYRQFMARFRASFGRGMFFDHTVQGERIEQSLEDIEATLEVQEEQVEDNAEASVNAAEESYDAQVDGIYRSVHTAEESATTARSEATARITAMADHFELGMSGETSVFEEGSQSFFAQAGWELGEGEPQRVRDTFQAVIHGPVPGGGKSLDDSFADQVTEYREQFLEQVTNLEATFDESHAFDPIIKAANDELHERSNKYDSAANSGFLGGSGTDEDGMIQALQGLTTKGMDALDFVHQDVHGVSLEWEARDELSGEDLGDDLATALAYIEGRNADAALHVAHSSTGWWGLSRETREGAIRSLTPEERAQMVADPDWASAAQAISELPATEAGITQALVEGDTARAFALHLEEQLETQRRRVNEDGIQDVVNNMETRAAEWIDGPFRAGRVPPERARALTVGAFREHAIAVQGMDPERVEAMGEAEVAGLFASHATRDMQQYVSHGEGHGEMVTVSMSSRGSAAIRDTVVHGARSAESRASRLLYEQDRARTGGVTETRTERIMDVAENPALRSARQAMEEAERSGNPESIRIARERLDREEATHQRFLRHYAEQSGADEATLNDPQALEDHVASSVGTTFAGEHSRGRTFGESMIRTGRVDLIAATEMAVDGTGTHENLLRRAYGGRSREELEQFQTDYEEATGETLESRLYGGTFSELSGDDAIDVRRALRGEPSNDRELLSNMYAYSGDELQGTGPDGRRYMSGTREGAYLHEQRDEARQSILDALAAQGVPEEERWAFDAQGNPNPRAFDARGNFLGDRTAFLLNTGDLQHGANAYRAELEQAESLLTSIIQAIGAIVGVLLMFVPGVNILVAGIITAIVIGAATMAIKAGMRGSRYGWEEQAVDIGTTAVDAATAGLGAIGQTARVAGTAARTGSALAKSIGREALSGFISSAANTAMQDHVWADGFGAGLGRVLGAGVRGSLVGAVTAGVSDGLSNKLDAALNPRVVGEATETVVRGASHGTRRAISEALSEAAGSVAGEAAGSGFDALSGQKVDIGQMLGNIAFAGVRDLVTGGLRGRVMAHQQRRMRDLTRTVLSQPGPPTTQQLRLMHRLAITTGGSEWGRRNFAEFAADFHARRQVLADLPPNVRRDFADLPLQGLVQLRHMLETGDAGSLQQRRALAEMMAQASLQDVSLEMLALDLQRAVREGAEAHAVQRQTRRELLSGAPVALRRALAEVPLHELAGLDAATLREVGQRLARGEELDGALRDAVVAQLHRLDPAQDRDAIQGALDRLQTASRVADAVRLRPDAPDAVRQVVGELPEALQRTVRDLLEAGVPPSAREREALRQALGDRADALISALPRARAEVEGLGDLPPAVRSVLSELPEDAVHALRMLQARGEASPHEKVMLLQRALESHPELDGGAFLRAIDVVVSQHSGAVRVPAAQGAEHRRLLLAGLPSELHGLFADVPITVVRAEVFEAATRNPDADAVTILVDGQPRVLLREGSTDPAHALREEGLHVLQLMDPAWAEHLRFVSEEMASRWHELSLGERVEAHRRQVALEVDAQRQLLAQLMAELSIRPTDADLLRQITVADARLRGLLDRRDTLEALGMGGRLAIRAGLQQEPEFLHQPARLFSEEDARREARPTRRKETELDQARRALSDPTEAATLTQWLSGQPQLLTRRPALRREIASALASPEARKALLTAIAAGRATDAQSTRAIVQGAMLADPQGVPEGTRHLRPEVAQALASTDAGAEVAARLNELAGRSAHREAVLEAIDRVLGSSSEWQDPHRALVDLVRSFGDRPAAEQVAALQGLAAATTSPTRTLQHTLETRLQGLPQDSSERRALEPVLDTIRLHASLLDSITPFSLPWEIAAADQALNVLRAQLAALERDHPELAPRRGATPLAPGADAFWWRGRPWLRGVFPEPGEPALTPGQHPVRDLPEDTLRSEVDLDDAAVARILNEQLDHVLPEQIAAFVRTFDEADQPHVRRVLALASGFASLESFNAMYAAVGRHLEGGSKLYLAGAGSVADNLAYLHSKSAFSGDLPTTENLERGAIVILDEVLLGRLQNEQTGPALLQSLIDHQCVLLHPRGLTEGLRLFDPFGGSRTRDRVVDLLARARALHQGDESFDEAIHRALDQRVRQVLHGRVAFEAVGPPTRSPDSDMELARQLSGYAGVNAGEVGEALRANLRRVPESISDAMPLMRELVARLSTIHSPRTLAAAVAQHHREVMDYLSDLGVDPDNVHFYIPARGRSYGLIAMAHQQATDTPAGRYINGADEARNLGPEAVVVILDDVAGSGGSMQKAIRGYREEVVGLFQANPRGQFQGTAIVAPLFSTPQARSRFTTARTEWGNAPMIRENVQTGQVHFVSRREIQSLETSPFFRSLPPALQEVARRLLGPALGYKQNALFMVFPYMSPNNNNEFFASFLAHYFILNRNRAAVKPPE